MSGLLKNAQVQALLQPETPRGLLGVSGQAKTYAQRLGEALKRLPDQLLSPEYARVFEPQGAAADMSRRAFWQGSVMGVPEDVKKREMQRAMDIALAAPTVYHGSPHRFDKFDSSKIGTGEGAQAYGHGIYFAESPKVAKAYQEALSRENILAMGRVYTPDDLSKLPDAQRAAISAGSTQGIDGNLKRAQEMLNEGADPKWIADFVRYTKQLAGKPLQRQTEGSLYTVDLPDAMAAKMLDWDKPLSQQAPEVQAALEPLVAPIRAEMAKPASVGWGDFAAPQKYDPTGSELLQLLAKDKSMSAQNVLSGGVGPDASARARSMGIPGIRYLDGGSRGAGAGTSNYVVFPGGEDALSILKRE